MCGVRVPICVCFVVFKFVCVSASLCAHVRTRASVGYAFRGGSRRDRPPSLCCDHFFLPCGLVQARLLTIIWGASAPVGYFLVTSVLFVSQLRSRAVRVMDEVRRKTTIAVVKH